MAKPFELFPSQERCVERIARVKKEGGNGVILALPFGSGKTVVFLEASNRLVPPGGHVLVVTQLSPMQDCRDICARVMEPPMSTYVVKGRTDKKEGSASVPWYEIRENRVVLVNYELLAQAYKEVGERARGLERPTAITSGTEALFANTWDMLVLDEAHEVRNPDTLAHQAVAALRARFRVLATATPFNNSSRDVEAQLRLAGVPLDTQLLSDALARYLIVEEEAVLARNKLHYSATRVVVRCDFLDREERAAYDGLRPRFVGAREHLELLNRQRQACCGLFLREHVAGDCWRPVETEDDKVIFRTPTKTRMLLQYLQEVAIPRGEKSIVFCGFRGTLKPLKAALEAAFPLLPVFLADGSCTSARRRDVRQSFDEAPGAAVLACTMVFSQGTNFPAANHVVIYDPWWNPAVDEQSEMRVERPTQTRAVFKVCLLVRGTVDDSVWWNGHLKRRARSDLLSTPSEEDVPAELPALPTDVEVTAQIREGCDVYVDDIGALEVPDTKELVPLAIAPPLVPKPRKPGAGQSTIHDVLRKGKRGVRPVQAEDQPKKPRKNDRIRIAIQRNIFNAIERKLNQSQRLEFLQNTVNKKKE